jgi:hypothetical protein
MNKFIILLFFLFSIGGTNANMAKDSMDKLEARQKVRINNGGGYDRDRYIRKRSWRGEECDVNVGRTYVEERRHGREINVYSYAGDVSVRCD